MHTHEGTVTAVSRSRAADPAGLFDANVTFVWRSLRYFGVHEVDLADQAQEVFMIAFRKKSGFEHRSSLRTWLYGICLRVAANYRRLARHRREVLCDKTPEGESPSSPELRVDRLQARARLAAALDEIDVAQREVFVLREVEDLPMTEVAEVIGCPLQTAYSRHQAARRALRAILTGAAGS